MPIEELSVGKRPVCVDIVFVHGLCGDLLNTWTSSRTLWPRDLLSKDFPNARIITWGYDSNVVNFFAPSSKNSLFGHANNLLTDVATLRDTRDKVNPYLFKTYLNSLRCANKFRKNV